MTGQEVKSSWLGNKFGTPVAKITSAYGNTMVLTCQVQPEEFRSAMQGISIGDVIDADWAGRKAGEKLQVARIPYAFGNSNICIGVKIVGGYDDAPLIKIGIKDNRM